MDSTEPPAGANAVEAVKQYNRVRASLTSQHSYTPPMLPVWTAHAHWD